jgi:hypothetical protein
MLDEKFKLFSGVFGASDEVLGAIESGVDFEKRIVQIYQTCRTPEQIEFNFNALQKELEAQIDEKMQQTRKKLLENFDEEVHEKLKMSDLESSDYLTKFDNWLWQLTRYFLKPFAQFEDGQNAFVLTQNPFPEENIHPGPYRSGKNVEDANLYRVGHPLAQRIIQKCKTLTPAAAELVFKYTGCGKTISILEPLVGKSGWLCLTNLTVSSFDTEDWLLFAGVTDDNQEIDPDQCQRLFSLTATESSQLDLSANTTARGRMDSQLAQQQKAVLTSMSEKNATFFELEMEKLEGWAGDLKESLEHELKEIDREIKDTKREAQLAASLESKVALHKRIKELEARRAEKRRGLFEAQDAVDTRKDSLLSEIEARLKQGTQEETLFSIRWRVE